MTQLEELKKIKDYINSGQTWTLEVNQNNIYFLNENKSRTGNISNLLPDFKQNLQANIDNKITELSTQNKINELITNLYNLYSEDLTVILTAFDNLKQQEGVDITQIENTLQELLNQLNQAS